MKNNFKKTKNGSLVKRNSQKGLDIVDCTPEVIVPQVINQHGDVLSPTNDTSDKKEIIVSKIIEVAPDVVKGVGEYVKKNQEMELREIESEQEHSQSLDKQRSEFLNKVKDPDAYAKVIEETEQKRLEQMKRKEEQKTKRTKIITFGVAALAVVFAFLGGKHKDSNNNRAA